MRLKGKRALVTGSTAGIGAVVVKRLAAEGATVAIHGRNRDRAEAIAAEIRNEGSKMVVVLGELAKSEGCHNVAQAVFDVLGCVDILVNNAGGSDDTTRTWETSRWQDWIEELEMNTGSSMRPTELALPIMIGQRWGRIVNVSSAQATIPSRRALLATMRARRASST